jgi:hypothetical protein
MRSLRLLIEELRRYCLNQYCVYHCFRFLIDTTPVKCSKKHSYFAGSANYSYLSSKDIHYFDYKLVVLTTCQGITVIYDLVPVNLDELLAT